MWASKVGHPSHFRAAWLLLNQGSVTEGLFVEPSSPPWKNVPTQSFIQFSWTIGELDTKRPIEQGDEVWVQTADFFVLRPELLRVEVLARLASVDLESGRGTARFLRGSVEEGPVEVELATLSLNAERPFFSGWVQIHQGGHFVPASITSSPWAQDEVLVVAASMETYRFTALTSAHTVLRMEGLIDQSASYRLSGSEEGAHNLVRVVWRNWAFAVYTPDDGQTLIPVSIEKLELSNPFPRSTDEFVFLQDQSVNAPDQSNGDTSGGLVKVDERGWFAYVRNTYTQVTEFSSVVNTERAAKESFNTLAERVFHEDGTSRELYELTSTDSPQSSPSSNTVGATCA